MSASREPTDDDVGFPVGKSSHRTVQREPPQGNSIGWKVFFVLGLMTCAFLIWTVAKDSGNSVSVSEPSLITLSNEIVSIKVAQGNINSALTALSNSIPALNIKKLREELDEIKKKIEKLEKVSHDHERQPVQQPVQPQVQPKSAPKLSSPKDG